MRTMILFLLTVSVFCEAQALPAQTKQKLPRDASVNKPTPKEGQVEQDAEIIKQEQVGKRVIFPYKEESAVSFNELKFLTGSGEFVTPKLDRVILIQYWSSIGLKRDAAWDDFIENQKKYSDNKQILFLSVFFDLSSNAKETFAKTVAWLKENDHEVPKNLFFDYNDSFRSVFQVYGGNSYYIIDNRRQLTYSSRGDFEEVHYVFDEIENALKNLEKDGYLPKRRPEFTQGKMK